MTVEIDERIWKGYCQELFSRVQQRDFEETTRKVKEVHQLLELMTRTEDSSLLQKSMTAFRIFLSANARMYGLSASPSNFFIKTENS